MYLIRSKWPTHDTCLQLVSFCPPRLDLLSLCLNLSVLNTVEHSVGYRWPIETCQEDAIQGFPMAIIAVICLFCDDRKHGWALWHQWIAKKNRMHCSMATIQVFLLLEALLIMMKCACPCNITYILIQGHPTVAQDVLSRGVYDIQWYTMQHPTGDDTTPALA